MMNFLVASQITLLCLCGASIGAFTAWTHNRVSEALVLARQCQGNQEILKKELNERVFPEIEKQFKELKPVASVKPKTKAATK